MLTGTTRIETTNREGSYTFRGVAPGSYQVRVLRVGYRPATAAVTVADGETARPLDFAMTAAPVQLDEIVTTATGEQRKLEIGNAVTTIDAGQDRRDGADHRVRQPALGPRGRACRCSRAAAPPAPAPASASAAPTASRSPTSRCTTSTASGSRAARARPPSTSAASARASRRTQGPSRINDIDPDDIEYIEIVKGPAAATLYGIQASNGVVRITTKHGTAGPAALEPLQRGRARCPTTTPTRSTTTGATIHGDRRVRRGFDGFCTIQSRARRRLHPDLGCRRYQPLNNADTRPSRPGLRQQLRRQRVRRQRPGDLLHLRRGYENENGVVPPARSSRRTRSARPAARSRTTRSGPNALEKYSVRGQRARQRLAKTSTWTPSLGFITSNTRFVENDNSFLTVNGSGDGQRRPPRGQPRLVLHPGRAVRRAGQAGGRTGSPAASPATGARSSGSPAGRPSATTSSTGPTCSSSPPARWPTIWAEPRGRPRSTTGSTSRRPRWISAPRRGSSSRPTVGSRTSVGGQFFRDLAARQLRDRPRTARRLGHHQRRQPPPRRRDTLVESRSVGIVHRGGDQPQGAPVRHRRPPLRRQQRVRQELQRHRLPQGQRVVAHVGRAVLPRRRASTPCGCARRYGASRPAAGHDRRAPVLHARSPARRTRRGTTGVTFGSLGNPDLKPERSARVRDRARRRPVQGPGVGRVHLLQQAHQGRPDRAADRAVRSAPPTTQFVNLSRIRNHGFELAINTRIIDKPEHRLGPDAERLDHEEQDPGPGRRA